MVNEKLVPEMAGSFVTVSQPAAAIEGADSSIQPAALVVHHNVACCGSARAMLS